MKVPVKSVAEIGEVIRITRICQHLDQLTAAQLSNAGQSFLSHLENGKETAQIGKVLQVLESLGIGIELVLPPDIDDFMAKENPRYENLLLDNRIVDSNLIEKKFSLSNSGSDFDNSAEFLFKDLWHKLSGSKRVRRS